MSKKLQIGVKILLLNPDKSKYLGITRNEDKKLEHPESVDIPGGRIELGEEPLEGLKRELKEEIGYELKSEPIILDASNIVNNKDRQIVRITYVSMENIDINDVNIGNEHQSGMLVNLEENDQFHPLLNKAIGKCKKLLPK